MENISIGDCSFPAATLDSPPVANVVYVETTWSFQYHRRLAACWEYHYRLLTIVVTMVLEVHGGTSSSRGVIWSFSSTRHLSLLLLAGQYHLMKWVWLLCLILLVASKGSLSIWFKKMKQTKFMKTKVVYMIVLLCPLITNRSSLLYATSDSCLNVYNTSNNQVLDFWHLREINPIAMLSREQLSKQKWQFCYHMIETDNSSHE